MGCFYGEDDCRHRPYREHDRRREYWDEHGPRYDRYRPYRGRRPYRDEFRPYPPERPIY
jgi:hypothetical protein